jgi:hypothetical protein
MSLPFRQERLLRRRENALRRSDPHLAGMLTIFTRISAGEEMPGRERLRTPMSWLCRPLARAAALTSVLSARADRTCEPTLLPAAPDGGRGSPAD